MTCLAVRSYITDFSETRCPLSLSLIPGRGACHRPNRLQKVQHALRVGRIQVAGGGRSTCLRVGRTAQEQMLYCLVVASAVWTQ